MVIGCWNGMGLGAQPALGSGARSPSLGRSSAGPQADREGVGAWSFRAIFAEEWDGRPPIATRDAHEGEAAWSERPTSLRH